MVDLFEALGFRGHPKLDVVGARAPGVLQVNGGAEVQCRPTRTTEQNNRVHAHEALPSFRSANPVWSDPDRYARRGALQLEFPPALGRAGSRAISPGKARVVLRVSVVSRATHSSGSCKNPLARQLGHQGSDKVATQLGTVLSCTWRCLTERSGGELGQGGASFPRNCPQVLTPTVPPGANIAPSST